MALWIVLCHLPGSLLTDIIIIMRGHSIKNSPPQSRDACPFCLSFFLSLPDIPASHPSPLTYISGVIIEMAPSINLKLRQRHHLIKVPVYNITAPPQHNYFKASQHLRRPSITWEESDNRGSFLFLGGRISVRLEGEIWLISVRKLP